MRVSPWVEEYLERIGYDGACEPTVEALSALHRAHLLSVPFENLDIPLGRRIVLSMHGLYEKVVRRRRGGFCYELNSLFGQLLEELGFRVQMLSGRVFNGEVPGREFDHMLLLLDTGEPWIADVGFGDSFREPISLAEDEQVQCGAGYRVVERDRARVLQRRRPDADWEAQYQFSLQPRRLDDFAAMCHYQQTSPASPFTRKSVCSMATPGGRITLSNGRLIVTSEGRREERQLDTAEECRAALKEHFGVVLEGDLEPLLASRAATSPDDS